MKVLHHADPLGLHPWYYRPDGTGQGPTIRDLLAGDPLGSRWDREGVLQRFENRLDGWRTCFRSVRSVPAGQRLVCQGNSWELIAPPAEPEEQGDVRNAAEKLVRSLSDSLLRAVHRAQRPALALSGGLDSALLLALLRQLDISPVRVYTLAANLPGYGELAAAQATARELRLHDDELIIVPACEDDFVKALPATIRACEAPLYNAHPVSKQLLAQALRADGVDLIITGDGADQAFAGRDGRDYLPLVGAIFRSSGVSLCAPFAEDTMLRIARRAGVDEHKSALRAAACGLVPEACLARAKCPTLTPPIPLDGYLDEATIQRLSQELQLPLPQLTTDRERMFWATLALLVTEMSRPTLQAEA